MKKTTILFVALVIAVPLFGQTNRDRAIDRGRIHVAGSQMIECQHLVLSGDTVEYYAKESSSRYALGLKSVNLIEEYRGNNGSTGSLVGALLGAGIGVAVALGTKETKTTGIFEETTIQTWPIYVGTLLGGVIGYAIGNSAESWEPIYSSEKGLAGRFEIRSDIALRSLCITYRLNL
ncbi:MAG: hypothetical protein HY961_03265 [Ignavibacteriae bacterium]|nr:hypothetical protein [Ignavibacteriota bacterium]